MFDILRLRLLVDPKYLGTAVRRRWIEDVQKKAKMEAEERRFQGRISVLLGSERQNDFPLKKESRGWVVDMRTSLRI